MPPRNLNVILIAACVSLLCYATYRRARTAMIVGDALDLINTFYVDPVDDEKLLIAAMDGMTGSLDQHSSFIPGEAYESFQDSINQEFAGIGIFVEQPEKGKPVQVITPLVGSPALEQGVLPNDQIVVVDGVDVTTMDLKDVSDRLKGPVGTNVRIQVKRLVNEPVADPKVSNAETPSAQEQKSEPETKLVSFTIPRATIALESVIGDHRGQDNKWVYRLESDPDIAYIRLTSFGEKTVRELARVLAHLNNEFKALVLDLRGNSGGLLYAARDVSDMFLEKGRIVSTKTRGGKLEESYEAQAGTLVAANKPLTVLIDGGSASASEIVAACLQDNERAVVVGTRSYGKGTVQNILPLQFGRSALRLTVARYYRPSDENIHRGKDDTEDDVWGVKPNDGFLVSVDEETLIKLGQRWREASYPLLATPSAEQSNNSGDQSDGETEDGERPFSVNVDPQLRRAVDHLREELNGKSPSKSNSTDEAEEAQKVAA